jgi:hypothetical protein
MSREEYMRLWVRTVRARTGAAPPSHDLDRLKAWSGQLAAASEHADRTCTDAGALGAFAT